MLHIHSMKEINVRVLPEHLTGQFLIFREKWLTIMYFLMLNSTCMPFHLHTDSQQMHIVIIYYFHSLPNMFSGYCLNRQ